MIIQKKFLISEPNFERELFGNFDENIKLIEKSLNIDLTLREGNLILIGEEKNVEAANSLMNELHTTVSKGKSLDKQSILYSLSLLNDGDENRIQELEGTIVLTKKGTPVQPKTLGQKEYVKLIENNDITFGIGPAGTGKTYLAVAMAVQAFKRDEVTPKTLGQKEYVKLIENNDITFGIGPAGTGKTYLAVAMAVQAFKRDEVTRIVLTRPAVEAGESLGYLPGDLQEKIDPYLRPLYDALFEMLGGDKVNKYIERGIIEVAPLAFMRGRTLDNAFIILDEAQNTTSEQMKMFLTR